MPIVPNSASTDPAPGTAPLPASCDAVIVGAGVIGLSIAWRLASRGMSVVAIDRGYAGCGASLAATGMLAAAAEFEPGGLDLVALALESQRLWPTFRDALEAASGRTIDYRDHGTMLIALGRDEVARARFRCEQQLAAGLESRWLSGEEIRDREPALRPSVVGGILCPNDHQVDPPRMIAALKGALRSAAGTLVEGTAVNALDLTAGRIAGVTTTSGAVRAPLVVLATGVAIGSDGLVPAELRVPVRPLKGQSLALRMNAPSDLSHVVWTEQLHLAPKGDHRLVVGATVEERGFDSSVTAGGVYSLLEGARRALPALEEMELIAMWSGWRPTSDDDAPVIGATGLDGLVLAAGHHRNGYLLAPVTAQAIEDLVITGRMPPIAAGFDLSRFAGANATRPTQEANS